MNDVFSVRVDAVCQLLPVELDLVLIDVVIHRQFVPLVHAVDRLAIHVQFALTEV